jgi:hypothetical protein
MALGTSRLSPGFPGFPVSVIHHLSVQIEKPFDQTVQNEPGRPAFIQRNGIVPDRGVLPSGEDADETGSRVAGISPVIRLRAIAIG